MKKLILTIAVLLVCKSAFSEVAFSQTQYSTYNNKRYFFSIEYPSDLLKIQPPSFMGDGRAFVSDDKSVEMRAWGNYNSTFLSLRQQLAADTKSYNGSIRYKRVFVNGFVFSVLSKGKIFYQKTLYHKFKNTDVFYTLTVEYPEAEKKKFDAIIARVSRSFRYDPKAEV